MSETVQDAPVALEPRKDPLPEPLRRRWAMFAVVGLGLLMFSLDQTSVATALTSIGHELGGGVAWTGWTITIYSVGQILALPLGGRLSDQFGGRRVFLASVLVFTVMLVACGLSGSLGQLIVSRFVQGLAGGVLLPAGSGLIAHAFGRDRDRALALFTSVFPIGAIAGPLLGGLVLTVASWRAIFLIGIPLGLAIMVFGWFLLVDPPRRKPKRVDAVGIALITGTLVAGMTAVARLGSLGSGWSGPAVVVGAMALAGLGGWAFVQHARRHPDPVVPLRLLRGGGLGTMNIVNVVIGASAVGFSAIVPLYAQNRYAMLPLAAGILLTVRAVGMIAASTTAVALLRRTGHKPLLMLGMIATVVSLIACALPPFGDVSPAVWLGVACVVMGIGMGLTAPSSNNAGMHLVKDDVSAMSGLRIMFRQFGAILSISVTTAVTAAAANPGVATAWALVVMSALMAGGALLAARIPNQRGRW